MYIYMRNETMNFDNSMQQYSQIMNTVVMGPCRSLKSVSKVQII